MFPVSNAVFVHVLVQMVEDRLQEKRISFTLMGGKYKPDIALFGQWSLMLILQDIQYLEG